MKHNHKTVAALLRSVVPPDFINERHQDALRVRLKETPAAAVLRSPFGGRWTKAVAASVIAVVLCLCLAPTTLMLLRRSGSPSDDSAANRPTNPQRARFEQMTTEQILALRQDALAGVPASGVQADAEHCQVKMSSLLSLVEENTIFVQGILESVEPKREYLIDDAVSGRWGPLFVTATFRVVESYPPIPEKTLALLGIFGAPWGYSHFTDGDEDRSARMTPGSQFLMLLQKKGGRYVHRSAFGGYQDFEIRGKEPDATVPGIHGVPGITMQLGEVWDLIRSLYEGIDGPSAQTAAATLSKLKYSTLRDARIALQFLSVYPHNKYRDLDLVESLERQYERVLAENSGTAGYAGSDRRPADAAVESFRSFAGVLLRQLYLVASEQAVDRVIALLYGGQTDLISEYFGNYGGVDFEVFRLALKHPGPAREGRVWDLICRRMIGFQGRTGPESQMLMARIGHEVPDLLASTPGEDMERIMRDMFTDPGRFGFSGYGLDALRRVQENFTETRASLQASLEMDSHLRIQVFLRQYFQGDAFLGNSIMYRIQPGDTSAMRVLLEHSARSARHASSAVWLKAPDPSFVPFLRQALEPAEGKRYLETILPALAACGEPEEALRIAREILDAPIPEGDARHIREDAYNRTDVLYALGALPADSAVELARRWLDPSLLASYQAAVIAGEATDPHGYRFVGETIAVELHSAALLALTRLGDPSTPDLWRELFQSGNTGQRMTAAIALYYLGDNTGRNLIDAFVTHEEEGIEELYRYRFAHNYRPRFQEALRYLRSPETDALILERIRGGLDFAGDSAMVTDLAFEMEHAGEVLPLLVQHLEARDPTTREEANRCLTLILGQRIEWEHDLWEDRFPAGAQPELVERWRQEVAAYLSTWTPVSTTVKPNLPR